MSHYDQDADYDNDSHSSAKDKMSVPGNKVGKIIGRRGAMIRELQDKSGANIDVTDEKEGNDTVIRLSGSLDTIDRAKRLITRLVQEDQQRGGAGGGGGGNSVEVWVPESKCGMIIGRGGSKISEIQSQTGTRVNVNSREKSENGMCLVTISGDKDNCEEAKAIVEEIVNRPSQDRY